MRLGLIAISGLRICNPQLLALGFTFPSVRQRAEQIESLPSLGLLTLAGMTPSGVETEYVEIRDLANWDEALLRFDAVALSALSATAREAYALADKFREAGVTVILGGLHATLAPLEAAEHADALVIGEGEVVWQQVVSDLLANDLQPSYDARAIGGFDLAEAPMPRFDLLASDRYPRFTVQTQRGCPFHCEFCAASIRLSAGFKVKPIERVVAEIRRIKELFPRPFIEFADDNTFADKAHAKRLMRALASEGVRWFTETDISVADDEELLAMMRDAGCAGVLIGLESPDAGALDGVELKSNWKARRSSGYRRGIERIQRHGIAVNGCFVLGLDGSDATGFGGVLRFAREAGLYDVQITYMTPFPGTPLYQRLSDAGRILVQGAWETCTLFDINFQPDTMSISELETGFMELAAELYDEAFVTERRRKFRSVYRETLRARSREAIP